MPSTCQGVTGMSRVSHGGQPLFSTKRVRKALRLAEIAVNDLQSNFLSKTFYEFNVCVYIYIYVYQNIISHFVWQCVRLKKVIGRD